MLEYTRLFFSERKSYPTLNSSIKISGANRGWDETRRHVRRSVERTAGLSYSQCYSSGAASQIKGDAAGLQPGQSFL